MPIIIDKDTSLEDIANMNADINVMRYTPKFFSSHLTGEGKNRGLIDKDTNVLRDQLKEHYTDMKNVTNITAKDIGIIAKETSLIGQYEATNKPNHYTTQDVDNYKASLDHRLKSYHIDKFVPIETINPHILNNMNAPLDFPLNTTLWELDDIDNWEIIDETDDYVLRGKVLFSHMTLFKEGHKRNGKPIPNKHPFILSPFLLLNVTHKRIAPTHIRMMDNSMKTVVDTHHVNVIPIDVQSSTDPIHYGIYSSASLTQSLDLFTKNRSEFGQQYQTTSSLVTAIETFVNETLIYETLSLQARRYAETSMSQFKDVIDATANSYTNTTTSPAATKALSVTLHALVNQLENIEQLGGKIKTPDLNHIYNVIMGIGNGVLSNADKKHIIQQSLRLLLAHRLDALDTAKQQNVLYQFDPKNDKIRDNVKNNKRYSNKQKDIILTTEPLVIGQAGAGSGKSHTVTGRIHYLQAQGEDLNKTLVLSFTNVAADNISQRFPGIKSRTLANMFHTIYHASFPSQHLSTPGTLINSLTLLNPRSNYFTQVLNLNPDDVVHTISTLIQALRGFVRTYGKNTDAQSAMRMLMNIVNNDRDMIMTLLDAVEQTTLELEQVLIHAFLDGDVQKLTIPEDYRNLNMIITDESQDISTFEYIMLIDMALQYGCQLLIVGDGSQTLYEFRNSDPRYLNALEASGVFSTYKLDVNYRSNQEVLSFANQLLKVIDANDYAKIQLQADSVRLPTEKSFKDKVHVAEATPQTGDRKSRQNILEDHLLHDINFLDWFEDKINSGDQIAFLAHSRRDVSMAEEALNKLLTRLGKTPDVLNITSKRQYEKKYISDVLIAIRRDFTQLNPADRDIILQMEALIDTDNPQVRKCFNKRIDDKIYANNVYDIQKTFKTLLAQPLTQAMCQDVRNKQRTAHDVMSHIMQGMIREETRQNNMQHVLNPKQALDLSKNQVIVSTIHASKGLEFDHTIVAHHETTGKSQAEASKTQEQLRMLFVACSRAKDSEWIINTRIKPASVVKILQSEMYNKPMSTAYALTLEDICETSQQDTP